MTGVQTCALPIYAVSKGFIARIELDSDSKPEFCEACAKAKAARQPFPKESKTRAEKYGKHVHWDLWGPVTVKSLNGHFYVAARIDDATRRPSFTSRTRRVKRLTHTSWTKHSSKRKPVIE